MRRRLLFATLSLLAAVAIEVGPAFGGHETLSALLPGSPLDGSRLFAAKGCLGCHGVYGIGGTAGPDLGRGILNRPLLEIAAVMWNHAPGMEHVFQEKRVARPTFEPPEMASLLAFLYYLGSLDPPGDAERGAVLLRDKGCQACHTVGRDGGKGGPDLSPYGRYASPLFLTAALWNRGRAMAVAMEQKKVTRPTFRGNDIPDLLAYIRSVGAGTERVYAPPGSPKRGEALFTRKRCAECHSVRGHGGKVGPDLAITLKGSLMRIAGAMWNHGPLMWARMAERGIEVPSLSTEEMSDLISYLYFFQFIDPPGDARRGTAVFKEKRCGSCHGAAGTRLVAPAFARVTEKLRTPLAVITAMWNHAGQMSETMVAENVAWPILKGGEMADLIAYLLRTQGDVGRTPALKGAGSSGARKDRSGEMRRGTIMRSLSMVAVLLGAFALASTAAAADLELGKQVYAKKCAACHGPDGKGNAKMAEMLKVKIPPLAASAAKTDAELLKAVSEGKKPMPPFGKTLSKDELDAVVAYAKGLATGKVAGGK